MTYTLYGLPFILQARIIPDYDREVAKSLLFDGKFDTQSTRKRLKAQGRDKVCREEEKKFYGFEQ